MRTDYYKFGSAALGQEFELKAYGHAGKPVMVFPTSCGRFFDYEDHGMIAAMAPFIEAGDITVFAVDGRDKESWYKPVRDAWIGRRHAQYEACVTREVTAFLRRERGVTEKYLATGNSFGGFHSANFFLKFPGVFDSAVCLSGLYAIKDELGGYSDDGVYFNEPLSYLPGLADEALLARLREGYLVIAHGGGAWEQFNGQAAALAGLCAAKGLTCWYDPWGTEWPHDWQTWRAQIAKYLAQFREGVATPRGAVKLTGSARRVNPLDLPA
jgi:esterase/lipase superfamily enzyme